MLDESAAGAAVEEKTVKSELDRDITFGEALLAGQAVAPTNFLGQRADAILKRYRELVGTRPQRRRRRA